MRLAVPLFAAPGKTSRPPDFPARGRTGKASGAAAPGGCRPFRSLCYTAARRRRGALRRRPRV